MHDWIDLLGSPRARSCRWKPVNPISPQSNFLPTVLCSMYLRLFAKFKYKSHYVQMLRGIHCSWMKDFSVLVLPFLVAEVYRKQESQKTVQWGSYPRAKWYWCELNLFSSFTYQLFKATSITYLGHDISNQDKKLAWFHVTSMERSHVLAHTAHLQWIVPHSSPLYCLYVNYRETVLLETYSLSVMSAGAK